MIRAILTVGIGIFIAAIAGRQRHQPDHLWVSVRCSTQYGIRCETRLALFKLMVSAIVAVVPGLRRGDD